MKVKLLLVLSLTIFSNQLLAQDLEAGRVLYGTCAACHGPNGEGLEALNAPKIAGQQAWYTVRQLQNFKNGVRGSDPFPGLFYVSIKCTISSWAERRPLNSLTCKRNARASCRL